MNHSELSSFIWGTADLLRSSFKQHEYGDIILPFTVMRRLDTVLEPTKKAVLDASAKQVPDALRDTMLKKAVGADFYNTSRFTMPDLLDDADGIRENITKLANSDRNINFVTSDTHIVFYDIAFNKVRTVKIGMFSLLVLPLIDYDVATYAIA